MQVFGNCREAGVSSMKDALDERGQEMVINGGLVEIAMKEL